VFDSDPYDEYVETINKLMASSTTIKLAEAHFLKQQTNEKVNGSVS
jgi:anthranilate synthase component I